MQPAEEDVSIDFASDPQKGDPCVIIAVTVAACVLVKCHNSGSRIALGDCAFLLAEAE